MASKVLETSLPPGSLSLFRGLFYSKENRATAGTEATEEEQATPTPSRSSPLGWKEKLATKIQQMGAASGVRDPQLLADLKHRLAMRDLDFERTQFSGWLTTAEDGSAKIDLVVRCKQPSIIYRLFFDDHVDVPIRLQCTDRHLRAEIPYRKTLDKLGCLITVILLAAFIIPGILWLYLTRSAREVWDVVHEQVVFPALVERLKGGTGD